MSGRRRYALAIDRFGREAARAVAGRMVESADVVDYALEPRPTARRAIAQFQSWQRKDAASAANCALFLAPDFSASRAI